MSLAFARAGSSNQGAATAIAPSDTILSNSPESYLQNKNGTSEPETVGKHPLARWQ